MFKSDTDRVNASINDAVKQDDAVGFETGNGGEPHQVAGGTHPTMRNQTGQVIGDDENSLKAGERGPTLVAGPLLLEKTQHFDHERIPERIVHARGYGARGYFELTDSLTGITKAKVLTETGVKTPVFVRFSTVGGNMGSSTRRAMCAALPSSSTRARATGTSSATTSRSSSSRTRSSSPT